ncbi:hypothetical protein BGZ91_002306 [Linnemannia elongata]|nr:hypothetical protein BGZ91_002306 [Linnemannia elongata]KAG0081482.1 hypothetical protein BGZ90_007941 [Linnemannia elongata]
MAAIAHPINNSVYVGQWMQADSNLSNSARTIKEGVLYEYIPITHKGEIPPPHYGHCMIEAYGDTMVILIGGSLT